MSPTMIAFTVGVFVGVLGGIFIIGILQMAREGGDQIAKIQYCRGCEAIAGFRTNGQALDLPEEVAGGTAQNLAGRRRDAIGIPNSDREEGKSQ